MSTSVTMDPTVLVGEYLPKVVAAGRSPSCSVLLPGMESPPAGRNRRVVCHPVRYSWKTSFLGVSPFPMNPVNLHSLKTLLLRNTFLPFCPSTSQTSLHYIQRLIQTHSLCSVPRHPRPQIIISSDSASQKLPTSPPKAFHYTENHRVHPSTVPHMAQEGDNAAWLVIPFLHFHRGPFTFRLFSNSLAIV